MHSLVGTFSWRLFFHPADNVVSYSSLSIKNIIPNQKPIIPGCCQTVESLSLAFWPPSLYQVPQFPISLYLYPPVVVAQIIWNGVSHTPSKSLPRWSHCKDIVMAKVNIIFFLPALAIRLHIFPYSYDFFPWFLFQSAARRDQKTEYWWNLCGRCRIIATTSMTLLVKTFWFLFSVIRIWMEWKKTSEEVLTSF